MGGNTLKEYLGDSVYAEINNAGFIILTTENGHPDDPRNKIYLEPNIYNALLRFVGRSKEKIKNARRT